MIANMQVAPPGDAEKKVFKNIKSNEWDLFERE